MYCLSFGLRILITLSVPSNLFNEMMVNPVHFIEFYISKVNQWGSSWSYGSWIYNYLCNQCLSPLMLWVRITISARCTTLCDNVCQWLATGRWFSLGTPVSSTNKTDPRDIPEILLIVALNTIKPNQIESKCVPFCCPLIHCKLGNRFLVNTYL